MSDIERTTQVIPEAAVEAAILALYETENQSAGNFQSWVEHLLTSEAPLSRAKFQADKS